MINDDLSNIDKNTLVNSCIRGEFRTVVLSYSYHSEFGPHMKHGVVTNVTINGITIDPTEAGAARGQQMWLRSEIHAII